jgi:hypothetical protein
VHLDTALNLAWLLLGASALAATLGLSRRASFSSKQLHLVIVSAIVVALFPYISATDDMLRIEHFTAQQTHLTAQQTHPNGSSHKASDDLLRLYETLDSPLIGGSCRIIFTAVFCVLLATPVRRTVRRSIPLEAGRSPPSLPYPV